MSWEPLGRPIRLPGTKLLTRFWGSAHDKRDSLIRPAQGPSYGLAHAPAKNIWSALLWARHFLSEVFGVRWDVSDQNWPLGRPSRPPHGVDTRFDAWNPGWLNSESTREGRGSGEEARAKMGRRPHPPPLIQPRGFQVSYQLAKSCPARRACANRGVRRGCEMEWQCC